MPELVRIHNGRLRIERLAAEIEGLSDFGIAKPVEAVGLTDEQIIELKIKDLWTPKCFPSGGSVFNKDVYVFYSSSKKILEKTFRLSFLSHDKKKKGVWGTLHSQCMLTCAILLTSCIKGSDGVLGTHRNQSLLQY